jgi:hypothetical protein
MEETLGLEGFVQLGGSAPKVEEDPQLGEEDKVSFTL